MPSIGAAQANCTRRSDQRPDDIALRALYWILGFRPTPMADLFALLFRCVVLEAIGIRRLNLF